MQRKTLDTLKGGSRVRLARYRKEHADSLATIRGCRTPEAADDFIRSAGYTSPLNHRGAWLGAAHGLNLHTAEERAPRLRRGSW